MVSSHYERQQIRPEPVLQYRAAASTSLDDIFCAGTASTNTASNVLRLDGRTDAAASWIVLAHSGVSVAMAATCAISRMEPSGRLSRPLFTRHRHAWLTSSTPTRLRGGMIGLTNAGSSPVLGPANHHLRDLTTGSRQRAGGHQLRHGADARRELCDGWTRDDRTDASTGLELANALPAAAVTRQGQSGEPGIS